MTRECQENAEMYPCIISTILPSSATYHAVVASTITPNQYHLILNKGDHLQVLDINDGRLLQSVPMERDDWVVCMSVLPQPDMIILVTKQARVLIYGVNDEIEQLSNELSLLGKADLSEPDTLRPVKKPLLAVSEHMVVVQIHQGILRFLPTAISKRMKSFAVRVDELSIVDMTITASDELVVLHKNASDQFKFKCYQVPASKSAKALSVLHDEITLDIGVYAYKVCNAPMGGVLILTFDYVYYYHAERNIRVGAAIGATCFDAITLVDASRLLACDSDGMLHLIACPDGLQVDIDRLGRTILASSLAYLGDGRVFMGSASGDDQFIQLFKEPADSRMFQVIYRSRCASMLQGGQLVDIDGTGHQSLIACSGVCRNGGLVVLRNGVGLGALQQIAFPMDIADVDSFVHKGCRYLTVRLIEESHIFDIGSNSQCFDLLDELAESFERFIPSGESILLTKSHDGLLLVATSRRLTVYSENERKVVPFATAPCELASASGELVAVVLRKTMSRIDIYSCTASPLEIKPYGSVATGDAKQVSAVDIRKTSGGVAFIAVAHWHSSVIQVFKVDHKDQELVLATDCKVPSTVHSILLFPSSDSNWFVFAAFLDGTVAYFRTHQQGHFKVVSTSSTALPVRLFRYSSSSIFMSGDHPAFVKVDRSGLVSVLPTDLQAISAFAVIGSSCIAVARQSTLQICRLDQSGTKRHLAVDRWIERTLPACPHHSSIHQLLGHEHPVRIAFGSHVAACLTHNDLAGPFSRPDFRPVGRLHLLHSKTLSSIARSSLTRDSIGHI